MSAEDGHSYPPDGDDLEAALKDVAEMRALLNEPIVETVGRAWKHFEKTGSWPSFPDIEKAVLRALPPGTDLWLSLRQAPRWVGWLGDGGHPGAMTVKLLAVATCVGLASAPVLRNFWSAFHLARSIFLTTADDEKAELRSGILGSTDVQGRGMTQIEIRQVFALLDSEALLYGGTTAETRISTNGSSKSRTGSMTFATSEL